MIFGRGAPCAPVPVTLSSHQRTMSSASPMTAMTMMVPPPRIRVNIHSRVATYFMMQERRSPKDAAPSQAPSTAERSETPEPRRRGLREAIHAACSRGTGDPAPKRDRAGTPPGPADTEVGYSLPIGARCVGTPRVGLRTSEYGQDYRVGYGMQVLEQGRVNLELGIDAERRKSPVFHLQEQAGRTDQRVLGRATVQW